MSNSDNELTIPQLDVALTSLQQYLEGDGTNVPSLRANWIYLQIYATYGLRLPSTSETLQVALGIKPQEAAGFTWFKAMHQAYHSLDNASKYFFSNVFDKMTSLGENLKNYAEDVGDEEYSTFTLISNLVNPPNKDEEPDLESALEILLDLRKTALENAALAGEIKTNLGEYKTKLNSAQGVMQKVKTQVDNDDQTSQKTIDKLQGGKDIMGSLAQMQDLLDHDKAEYAHDVRVASTSVTYAWVFFIGLIAASTVAGVYAKRAVAMKDTIDKLEKQIKSTKQQLDTAISTQTTVTLAQKSINSALKHTDTAIEKTTKVQNSWNTTASGLDYISKKVSGSIRTRNEAERLASKAMVVNYMVRAQKKWSAIKPTIDQMVEDPYIKVEAGNVTMSDFGSRLVAEANKLQ